MNEDNKEKALQCLNFQGLSMDPSMEWKENWMIYSSNPRKCEYEKIALTLQKIGSFVPPKQPVLPLWIQIFDGCDLMLSIPRVPKH